MIPPIARAHWCEHELHGPQQRWVTGGSRWWVNLLCRFTTVAVQRALSHVNTDTVVKRTKTDRTRVVMLNASLCQILAAHHAASPHAQETDWICGDAQGRHLLPRAFSKFFTKLAAQLQVTITLHGLRHTHATALILAGVPVKVVSERLGHATVDFTQDYYTHVLPTMQAPATALMESLWQQAASA